MVGDRERRVGHEVGGREAERAPALVAVGDDPAHPERRAQQPRGLGDRAGRDQPADVRRGHDLAVDLDQLHHARRERVCAASSAASPCARWPKRKFSPTETWVAPRRATSSWSMNSCAVCDMRSPSNGITISSSTPSAAIRSAFCSSVVSSLGADCRRDHRARVRFERQDAVGTGDHLAVAGVHAVELAHREAARPGRRVGEPNGVHQPRKPTMGLRVAPPRGSASAIRPVRVAQPDRCPGAAGNGDAVGRLGGVLGARGRPRAGTRARRRGDQALLVGVRDVEVADAGPAQLDAVRVAEVHDQRAT